MKITITNRSPITGTTRELADYIGCTYPEANHMIKILEDNGIAKDVGRRTPNGGRGKPSTVYEVPSGFSFDIS